MLMISATSISGCASVGYSETGDELRHACSLLRRALPDFSVEDVLVRETKVKILRFDAVFEGVCPRRAGAAFGG
jgi:hypothetical protein